MWSVVNNNIDVFIVTIIIAPSLFVASLLQTVLLCRKLKRRRKLNFSTCFAKTIFNVLSRYAESMDVITFPTAPPLDPPAYAEIDPYPVHESRPVFVKK